MTQELRRAINKIEVTGVVKESKLGEGKGESGKFINGSLVISCGNFKEVEIKVFVSEKTKEGKVKKAYTTLQSILDKDVKTLADGANEEEAVKVRISGNGDFTPQLREEMYVTDANPDEVTTRISLDLGFGNISLDDRIVPENYKAAFDVEMYVAKIEEEQKSNEETGRVLIKGYTPVYGGLVIPLTIVAGVVQDDEDGEFDFAEQIRCNISEGATINLWGDIDYRSIITTEKKGGGLGKAKVEEKRTYINDLVATGGEIIDNVSKEFDEELIRQAITERETKKDEVLQKSKEDSGKDKKGKGLGGGNSAKDEKKKAKIPF